jgi:hypothetical protein
MFIDRSHAKHNIFIIRNAIPANVCDIFKKFIEESDKNQDINTDYLKAHVVKNNDKQLCSIMFKFIRKILKSLRIPDKMLDLTTLQYKKVFGETTLHKDGIDYIGYDTYRCISMIFSFDSNKGGLFHFPAQDIKFKLNKGDAVMFPPYWTHTHEVTAPEPGTFRYTALGWLYKEFS